MLQAAAAFGGGIYLKQKLDNVQFPQLRLAGDNARTFTLSVKVVAASVPGLDAPGFLSHQRPLLEAALGGSKKETEFADFATRGDRAGPYAEECPWRFGDTLTFKVRPEDLVGPGLRLSLHVRRDIVLGPLQFELRASEVAAGVLDLQSRVMPACVNERGGGPVAEAADGMRGWESPVVLVPLVEVRSTDGAAGLRLADGPLNGTVAHVAVVFSMDVDPEALLAALRAPTLVQRFEEGVDGVMSWFTKDVNTRSGSEGTSCDAVGLFAKCRERPAMRSEVDSAMEAPEQSMRPLPPCSPQRGASGEATWAVGPDLSPEGWICHKGPNGRTFWHHQALGPPPWESMPGSAVASGRQGALPLAARRVFDSPPLDGTGRRADDEGCVPRRGKTGCAPLCEDRPRSRPLCDDRPRSRPLLPRGVPATEVFGEEPSVEVFAGGSSGSAAAARAGGFSPQPVRARPVASAPSLAGPEWLTKGSAPSATQGLEGSPCGGRSPAPAAYNAYAHSIGLSSPSLRVDSAAARGPERILSGSCVPLGQDFCSTAGSSLPLYGGPPVASSWEGVSPLQRPSSLPLYGGPPVPSSWGGVSPLQRPLEQPAFHPHSGFGGGHNYGGGPAYFPGHAPYGGPPFGYR